MSSASTPAAPAHVRVKIVLVGDNGVGKTMLLFAYTQKRFRGNLESPSQPHPPVLRLALALVTTCPSKNKEGS